VNVPIGLVAAVLASARLSESHGPVAPLDIPGLALISAGAVAIIWGLIRAGDDGWTSITSTGLLAAGAALLGGFVLWEAVATAPMLPLRLFGVRTFAAAVLAGFLVSGTVQSAAFMASQYFQLGLGYTPLQTGLRFLPWTGMAFLVAPVAGRLSDRIGARPLIVSGLLIQSAALFWMASVSSTDASYARFLLPLVVGGIGISMALPTTPAAALGAVAPHELGKASGIYNTMNRFGAAFCIAVVSAVFASNGHLTSGDAVVAGFRPATAVIAALSIAGAVVGLAVGSRRAATASVDVPLAA
jgi:hypothetical protein